MLVKSFNFDSTFAVADELWFILSKKKKQLMYGAMSLKRKLYIVSLTISAKTVFVVSIDFLQLLLKS